MCRIRSSLSLLMNGLPARRRACAAQSALTVSHLSRDNSGGRRLVDPAGRGKGISARYRSVSLNASRIWRSVGRFVARSLPYIKQS